MRLSRKAQERADELVARLSITVRSMAAEKAQGEGREFADESDVDERWRLVFRGLADTIKNHE